MVCLGALGVDGLGVDTLDSLEELVSCERDWGDLSDGSWTLGIRRVNDEIMGEEGSEGEEKPNS